MKTLLRIFDLADIYSDDLILDTYQFFFKTAKRKKAFKDITLDINTFADWMELLKSTDVHFYISNIDHSLDYVHLTNSIESGQIKEFYLNARLIRQELLSIATKDEFEEMKKLHEFWENLEVSLMRLCH